MGRIRLTKEFSYEMAHMLEGYDGPCREIHGHSYKLFVTVIGAPCDNPQNPKYGMVMDFGVLKRIVNRLIVDVYDHSMLLRRTDSNVRLVAELETHFEKVRAVDFQPTCENLVERFAALLSPELPEGVELFSLRLHETATSYAEWFASDNI